MADAKKAAAREAFRKAVQHLSKQFPDTPPDQLAAMLQGHARSMSAQEAIKATIAEQETSIAACTSRVDDLTASITRDEA